VPKVTEALGTRAPSTPGTLGTLGTLGTMGIHDRFSHISARVFPSESLKNAIHSS
jgi:hypothetical protein